MSYSNFLQFIKHGIDIFVNNFGYVLESLIHNYFIITLLGLGLFISLVCFIVYIIHYFVNNFINRYVEYDDKYHNYELLQKVKHDYLNRNRLDVYDYLYDYKVLQYQVLNGIYQRHPQILLENKVMNFQLNADALKLLKHRNISDEVPNNDNDADMFSNIPVPPIQMANSSELKLKKNKPMSYDELHLLHEYNKADINKKIDDITTEFLGQHPNLSMDNEGHIYDKDTGEVFTK